MNLSDTNNGPKRGSLMTQLFCNFSEFYIVMAISLDSPFLILK